MPTCSRITPSVTKQFFKRFCSVILFTWRRTCTFSIGFNFVPPKPEVARFFMSHFGLDLKDVNSLLWSKQGPKGNHGDFVSIREPSCIAELWGHFQFKENFVSLVSPLEKVGKNKCQKKGSLIFVESTGIMGSVIYRNEAEDVIYVVPESLSFEVA